MTRPLLNFRFMGRYRTHWITRWWQNAVFGRRCVHGRGSLWLFRLCSLLLFAKGHDLFLQILQIEFAKYRKRNLGLTNRQKSTHLNCRIHDFCGYVKTRNILYLSN